MNKKLCRCPRTGGEYGYCEDYGGPRCGKCRTVDKPACKGCQYRADDDEGAGP